jgi:hypothetical protein
MFSREDLAQACIKWGRLLAAPAGVDGAKLLWALSGCESSFGENCKPRHEPYYHALAESGKNAQLNELTALFGCDAHSSFGPWQILLINCVKGTRPEEFIDLDRCAVQTVNFINRRILAAEKATTVAEIADAYNSGDWRDRQPASVAKYVADCQRYYDTEPMPG